MVAIFGEYGGHVVVCVFESVPVAFFYPIRKCASADIEVLCDLCFGEVCLKEEISGL